MADEGLNLPIQSASSTRRSSESNIQTSQLSSDLGKRSTVRNVRMDTSQESYGTIRPETSSRSSHRPKPPSRRTTSLHFPKKGQEFSVDDAQDEVDEENPRQKKPEKARPSFSMSKSQATIRRRPTNSVKMPTRENILEPGEESHTEEREPPVAVEEVEEEEEEDEDGEEEQEEAENLEEDMIPPLFSDGNSDENGGQDEGELSDTESFTLKDRQDAINVTHPFGIRIWKPALYKKSRSVQKTAEDEIHSVPGLNVSPWLKLFNYLWTILFGWWLAVVSLAGSLVCLFFGLFSKQSLLYANVLFSLSTYLFYPFGKFIRLLHEEAYADEDEGEGRSISEYEQWQSGDIEEGRLFFGPLRMNRSLIGRRRSTESSERQSLLGRVRREASDQSEHRGPKTRFFGRGKWNIGRVVFFLYFHLIISPFLLGVSALCWFLVFSIPMGKVTWMLWDHLRRRPLALDFHSQSSDARYPDQSPSSVLLCTYRAVGLKYWKYTIDGTNIFLFNLLGMVFFTIFDYYVLYKNLKLPIFLTSQGLIFAFGLLSIIPLAYFIGQAVASISAQSSMGVGATVNAFFSTVVEVFLYCVALKQGKAQLVEGSIIGSIFAGILFLPGLSMCFGALKRKTQRFNVKSAGVTSTMMLFAMIGAFSPTLFYQIYGSHELKCHDCSGYDDPERDCRRCFFSQTPAVYDRFFQEAVRPFIWICAAALFFSYLIGLLFTLRTHAAIIWSSEQDEKRMHEASKSHSSHTNHSTVLHESPEVLSRQTTLSQLIPTASNLPESQLYQRILSSSRAPNHTADSSNAHNKSVDGKTPSIKSPNTHLTKLKDSDIPNLHLQSLSEAENQALSRHVAEMAVSAAAVVANNVSRLQRKVSHSGLAHGHSNSGTIRPSQTRSGTVVAPVPPVGADESHHVEGGHDAPNWSKMKSAIVLLTATVAYAIIAEILVNTVDSVLESVAIDEKFLGITLFALVPNTTEFLNAISFAMNGNIALSMEIGSAYALQVCLLQIPCLVLFSALNSRFVDPLKLADYTFSLIFPQWDMVTVILCIFLLSYMYGEGKSNYFKGSILILAYCVVVTGFWFAGFDTEGSQRGVVIGDSLAIGSIPALKAYVASGMRNEL